MADLLLTGAKVVITGAAGALGSVVCRALVAGGAEVLATDRPAAAARLEQLGQELNCRVATLNAASPSDWAELGATGALLGVSGAVLIAGGWAGGAPLHAAPESELQAMLELNLLSAGVSLQALLRPMVERKSGSVVVIGSKNAVEPRLGAGSAAYTASKAGLVALAQAVAAEVRDHGVRVNAVLPSVIDTPANRTAMPSAEFTRWVSPESLAAVLVFLLSAASADVSGAALPVYGGS